MGENELQAICFWPRFIIFHFEPARPNRSDKHISSNQQREKWKGGLLGSPNINSSSWFSIAEIQDSGTWAWSCTPPSLYLEQGKKKKPSRSIHICITLPFEFRGAMSPYILPILPPKALVYTPQYPFLLRTCICANVCVCVWLHVCVCVLVVVDAETAGSWFVRFYGSLSGARTGERNPLIEGKDGEESKGVQFIKQIEYNVVS